MLLRPSSKLPTLAAASARAARVFAGTPASAEELKANLGPVGPYEPILATIGDKRMIAYYEPDGGKCSVSAVVFEASPSGGGDASTRVRVALHPGQIFHVDVVEDQRVVLTCGPDAGMLTVLNRGELVTKSASNALN
jgi:hypothetical protein